MILIYVVAYLTLCFLVALLARRSRLGFFRGFLFSVMMTPFIMLLFMLILNSLESEAKKTDGTPPNPAPDC